MNLLPERLKELRAKRNETQQQTADNLNVSRKLLSNYECGIREPSIDMLLSLARYYNVTIDYLVGASSIQGPYEQYPEFVVEFLNDYIYLSKESIADLENYIDLLKLRDAVNRKKK